MAKQNSADSQSVETEATDKTNEPGQSSLTKVAPLVHQDLRKIRVDPAFTGEDDQEVQLGDVQDDSDVEAMSDDDDIDNGNEEKQEVAVEDFGTSAVKGKGPEVLESGKEMALSDDTNNVTRKISVEDESTGKSAGTDAGQKMVLKDAHAENEVEEIIIDDDDDDVKHNQNEAEWIAVAINKEKEVADKTLDKEVEKITSNYSTGYEEFDDLSNSEAEVDTVDISDSEEEVIDLDSESDDVACGEEDSDIHIEKAHNHNQSDKAIADSDSDSENVSSTMKSKQKQPVQIKDSKKKAVAMAKLARVPKQSVQSQEVNKKSMITPSGKFSVTPNKYAPMKQKTGK